MGCLGSRVGFGKLDLARKQSWNLGWTEGERLGG